MHLLISLTSSLGFLLLIISLLIDGALALMVYRSNPKSATNKIFLLLSIAMMLWLSTYVAYLPEFGAFTLLLVRLGVFFAAPMSALFFLLAHTIPDQELKIGKKTLWAIIIGTAGMMAVNISPYAFSSASIMNGGIDAQAGIGLAPFSVLSTLFSVLAVYFLVKKFVKSQGDDKKQIRFVLVGMLLMLGLIIATVLVPLILFHSGAFVALLPVYSLIFLGMTAYAITQYHLFNLKVIATQTLGVVIAAVLFAKIFSATTLSDVIVDSLIFITVAFFGNILIKSVRKEVEQREELERLNKQIEEKNVQLEELSRFKSQLLSLASHQIKSPLAAIKGFVSLVSDGSYGAVPDAVKETMGKVQRSADELIELINTLLDVRKVEEGKMDYKFERTDLTKMTADMVEGLKPLAEAKKLEFSFISPGKEVWVNADPQKFKQVVQNLTDNAIKYTPSGFVHVELKEDAGMAVVIVSDSGLGIPAELLPQLFEEFIRDERVKKEIRGTGLGLYIARKITEAHGGTMNAESPGEGKGSTFRVKIPLAK
jgi:signal transduction histidine kinase